MYCSNCGNEVPDDAKVCPECGQDLSYESHEIRKYRSNHRKRKRGGKIAAVLITVIVLAAVFEGLWVFGPLAEMFSQSSGSDESGDHETGGGVTALISGSVAENESTSDSFFISNEDPTPTPTVTPIANLPEVSASVVETPTPEPTPTAEPTPAPTAEPTPTPTPAATPTPEANAAGTDSSYVLPGSDTALITESQLASMDAASIRLARNEIYARHGLIFKSQDLQDYFSKKSWYHGTVSNAADISLSDIERKNLSTITAYEASHR